LRVISGTVKLPVGLGGTATPPMLVTMIDGCVAGVGTKRPKGVKLGHGACCVAAMTIQEWNLRYRTGERAAEDIYASATPPHAPCR
jgi:hypothetical protein